MPSRDTLSSHFHPERDPVQSQEPAGRGCDVAGPGVAWSVGPALGVCWGSG